MPGALCFLLYGCSGGSGGGDGGLDNDGLPVVDPALFTAGFETFPAAILPFTAELKGISITPDGSKLYAIDRMHNSVSVFNLSTNRVSDILDVGSSPRYLAISADGKRVLVANSSSDTVTVIDASLDLSIATVPVGRRPFGMAITPDSSKAYIINSFDNAISVLDLTNNVVVSTISVGEDPAAVAFTPDGERAYVTNFGANSVSIIDTATDRVVATAQVGTGPLTLAISYDGASVYVLNQDGNSVSVLDVANISQPAVTVANVGSGPTGIAISPDSSRVYIANAGLGQGGDDDCGILDKTLSVIDASATPALIPEATELEVGEAPLALVITGDGKKLYAMSACTNKLSILDTTAVPNNSLSAVTSKAIAGQSRSTGIAIAPNSSRVYLAHPDAVSVIDVSSDTVVSTMSARGVGPTAVVAAETPSGARLFTANSGSDSVSVIDTASDNHIATVSVGSRPSHIAVTPIGDQAYVVNSGFDLLPDNSLSIISAATNLVSSLTLDIIGPVRMAISNDGAFGLIAHFGNFFPTDLGASTSAALLDLTSGQLASIDTDFRPSDVKFTTDGAKAFITNSSEIQSSLSVVDLGSALFPVSFVGSFGLQPTRVAITSDDTKAVVSNYRDNSVTVYGIATDTELATLSTGGPNPTEIAITEDDSKAYIINTGDRSFNCGGQRCTTGDSLFVLDLENTGNVLQPIKIGRKPMGIAISGDKAYVTNFYDDTVSVVDISTNPLTSNTVVSTLTVGKAPIGISAASNGKVYVGNSVSGTISIIGVDQNGEDAVVGTISANP